MATSLMPSLSTSLMRDSRARVVPTKRSSVVNKLVGLCAVITIAAIWSMRLLLGPRPPEASGGLRPLRRPGRANPALPAIGCSGGVSEGGRSSQPSLGHVADLWGLIGSMSPEGKRGLRGKREICVYSCCLVLCNEATSSTLSTSVTYLHHGSSGKCARTLYIGLGTMEKRTGDMGGM